MTQRVFRGALVGSLQPFPSPRAVAAVKSIKVSNSPLTTKKLAYGKHRFKVRAMREGLTDPSPAACWFTITRPNKKRN